MTTEYQEFVLAAHEAGLDVGTSSHGSILHAVDFDTDSVRAKAKGEPDQLACGKASDAERVDDGEEREICGNCLVELGVKEKRAVTDGGEELPTVWDVLYDAIEEHYDDEQCGAPAGKVVEEMVSNPNIDVGEVGQVLREGYFHGVIYQPSDTTLARVSTDGGQPEGEGDHAEASGEQVPTLGDVVEMDLDANEEDGRRWVVLFDEDYDDLLIDADDSVALLVDNNQACELLKLTSQVISDLAPEYAPDKDPIDAMIDSLKEVREADDETNGGGGE